MKKILFLSILFIGLSATGFSQSKKAIKKIEAQATKLVDKLNNQIITGDKTLALEDVQDRAIYLMLNEAIMCLEEGRHEIAKVVDHIIELRDGGKAYEWSNLMSLCHYHHNRKTQDEKNKRNGKAIFQYA